MMKKKAFFSVLIFAMILILAAALPLTAGAAEKNIKLRLSSVAAGPGQFPNSDSVKWWMDKVTEKTKGQVTFQSHWGASLAPPAGHIDLLEKGMVEIILGCRIYTPENSPWEPLNIFSPSGPWTAIWFSRLSGNYMRKSPDSGMNWPRPMPF